MCLLIAMYPTANSEYSTPAMMNIAGVAAPCTAKITGMPAASTATGATAETTMAVMPSTPSLLRASDPPPALSPVAAGPSAIVSGVLIVSSWARMLHGPHPDGVRREAGLRRVSDVARPTPVAKR
ncbi:unannotated protein [freshwater metagenome]|uniref:Unannotated protein n=1 Tax=freshwater metagenome TaxID=449393 RepID=A0A6J7NYD0_9ZZZZ